MIGIGIDLQSRGFLQGAGKSPQIQLSGSMFPAGSAQGTAIGTFSVIGGTGNFTTVTLTNNASNKAQTSGMSLQAGSAAASAGSFSITATSTSDTGSVATGTFLITAGSLISYEAAFLARWASPPPIYFGGTTFFTTFDITTVKPSIDVQYYLDPINGSDANDGLSRGSPLKSLSVALAKAPAGTTIGVLVINLVADFIARGSLGWNNTQATKNLVVEVEGPFRFISASSSTTTAPVFTKTAGQSIVYQMTFAPSTVSIGDVSKKTFSVRPDTGASNNTPPEYFAHTKVASIAAVDATPGTWFITGGVLYVSAFDSRDLSVAGNAANIIVSHNINNGRMGTTNGLTTYVSGIDFVGGITAFLAATSSAANTATLAHNNCSFQNANGGNALAVQGLITNYRYKCTGANGWADNFNDHSFNSDGTTPGTSPNTFQWNCTSIGAGRTGSVNASDNDDTTHDFCNGVDLNNIYLDSDDRPAAYVNSAFRQMFGTYVAQPITPIGQGALSVQNTAKVWCNGCVIATGASNQADIAVGAFLGVRNTTISTYNGGGSPTAY